MPSFKDPSFQDRVGQSAKAKKNALDQFRSRPPRDEKMVADRTAAAIRRETAKHDKASAKRAAETAAAKAIAAEAAAIAAMPAPPTDAERKAARDARYAARKNRDEIGTGVSQAHSKAMPSHPIRKRMLRANIT